MIVKDVSCVHFVCLQHHCKSALLQRVREIQSAYVKITLAKRREGNAITSIPNCDDKWSHSGLMAVAEEVKRHRQKLSCTQLESWSSLHLAIFVCGNQKSLTSAQMSPFTAAALQKESAGCVGRDNKKHHATKRSSSPVPFLCSIPGAGRSWGGLHVTACCRTEKPTQSAGANKKVMVFSHAVTALIKK